jgi:hypothetical protein
MCHIGPAKSEGSFGKTRSIIKLLENTAAANRTPKKEMPWTRSKRFFPKHPQTYWIGRLGPGDSRLAQSGTL